jgi:hypothetical protein
MGLFNIIFNYATHFYLLPPKIAIAKPNMPTKKVTAKAAIFLRVNSQQIYNIVLRFSPNPT